ncbi:hypothetical protein BJ912DRAFT_166923 [Pholiota molesta]|nr:hypothetical protein BJ912DRAFT_166923 [Pholiota molesta]
MIIISPLTSLRPTHSRCFRQPSYLIGRRRAPALSRYEVVHPPEACALSTLKAAACLRRSSSSCGNGVHCGKESAKHVSGGRRYRFIGTYQVCSHKMSAAWGDRARRAPNWMALRAPLLCKSMAIGCGRGGSRLGTTRVSACNGDTNGVPLLTIPGCLRLPPSAALLDTLDSSATDGNLPLCLVRSGRRRTRVDRVSRGRRYGSGGTYRARLRTS